MKNRKVVGGALALLRDRERAALRGVPGPGRVLTELRGIPFEAGDEVIDSVTGQKGVILGSGIEQVASEDTGD